MVRISRFHREGPGSIPGVGNSLVSVAEWSKALDLSSNYRGFEPRR
jgi:hypothetical protein